jgi:signal peptidase I
MRKFLHALSILWVPGSRALRRGNRRRAMVLQGAFVALFLLAFTTRLLAGGPGLAAFVLAFAALCAFSLRAGPVRGAAVRLRPWERAWLMAPQAMVVLVLAIPALRRPLFGYEVFRIPTRSNAPTLQPGDRFLAATGRFDPARGAMVLFRAPDDPERTYVKRVIGLPGDVVAGGPNGVIVNGEVRDARAVAPFGPVTVPGGAVFVVGDDLANSLDSRAFGCIEKASITGRPLYVVWSRTWSRIGTTLP